MLCAVPDNPASRQNARVYNANTFACGAIHVGVSCQRDIVAASSAGVNDTEAASRRGGTASTTCDARTVSTSPRPSANWASMPSGCSARWVRRVPSVTQVGGSEPAIDATIAAVPPTTRIDSGSCRTAP